MKFATKLAVLTALTNAFVYNPQTNVFSATVALDNELVAEVKANINELPQQIFTPWGFELLNLRIDEQTQALVIEAWVVPDDHVGHWEYHSLANYPAFV